MSHRSSGDTVLDEFNKMEIKQIVTDLVGRKYAEAAFRGYNKNSSPTKEEFNKMVNHKLDCVAKALKICPGKIDKKVDPNRKVDCFKKIMIVSSTNPRKIPPCYELKRKSFNGVDIQYVIPKKGGKDELNEELDTHGVKIAGQFRSYSQVKTEFKSQIIRAYEWMRDYVAGKLGDDAQEDADRVTFAVFNDLPCEFYQGTLFVTSTPYDWFSTFKARGECGKEAGWADDFPRLGEKPKTSIAEDYLAGSGKLPPLSLGKRAIEYIQDDPLNAFGASRYDDRKHFRPTRPGVILTFEVKKQIDSFQSQVKNLEQKITNSSKSTKIIGTKVVGTRSSRRKLGLEPESVVTTDSKLRDGSLLSKNEEPSKGIINSAFDLLKKLTTNKTEEKIIEISDSDVDMEDSISEEAIQICRNCLTEGENIKKMLSHIQVLESAIEGLQNEANQLDREASQSYKRKKEYKKKYLEIAKKYNENEQSLIGNKKDILESERRMIVYEDEINASNKLIDELTRNIETLKKKLEYCEKTSYEKNTEISFLKVRLNEVENQLDNYKNKTNDVTSKLKEAGLQSLEERTAITETKNEIEKLRSELNKVTKQKTEAEAYLNKARLQSEQYRLDNKELTSNLAARKDQAKRFEANEVILRNKITDLESKLNTSGWERINIEKEKQKESKFFSDLIDDELKQKAILTKEANELRKRLNELEQSQTKCSKDENNLKNMLKKLNTEKANLIAENSKSMNTIKTLTSNYQGLSIQIQEYEQRISMMNSEFRRLNTTIEDLRRINQGLTEASSVLAAERNDLINETQNRIIHENVVQVNMQEILGQMNYLVGVADERQQTINDLNLRLASSQHLLEVIGPAVNMNILAENLEVTEVNFRKHVSDLVNEYDRISELGFALIDDLRKKVSDENLKNELTETRTILSQNITSLNQGIKLYQNEIKNASTIEKSYIMAHGKSIYNNFLNGLINIRGQLSSYYEKHRVMLQNAERTLTNVQEGNQIEDNRVLGHNPGNFSLNINRRIDNRTEVYRPSQQNRNFMEIVPQDQNNMMIVEKSNEYLNKNFY